MYDFLLILIAAILGLLAHLSRNRHWLIWVLKAVIFMTGLLEFVWLTILSLGKYADTPFNSHQIAILMILFSATWLLLFMPVRQLASWLFTGLDLIITGQILVPVIRKKVKAAEYFLRKKVFVPSSFPHLMALFIYITAIAYLLISIDNSMACGGLCKALPIPPLLGQFLSLNGIGLILLSFFGVGLYVSRSGKEALSRLALFKLGKVQMGIAVILVFASFICDFLWAIYTHHPIGQDLATELSGYNPNSFTIAGSFIPSVIATLAITLCAAISEEILIRGALQPVFGIVPSALFHGAMHGQFSHTPALMVKVALWSTFMGLVKRYTNTSTAIVAHAGFNIITILLFALNP